MNELQCAEFLFLRVLQNFSIKNLNIDFLARLSVSPLHKGLLARQEI